MSRLREHFFAMGTLALQFILTVLFTQLDTVTGGTNGEPVTVIVLTGTALLYVVAAFAFVCTMVALRLERSRLGHAMIATKTDETMARTNGVNVVVPKVIGVAISFAMVGAAGWLFGQFSRYVSPSDFDLNESVIIFGVMILGGMASNLGPLVGAAIYVALTSWLQGFPGYAPLILGGVIIVLLLYARNGVAGAVTAAARVLRERVASASTIGSVPEVPAPGQRELFGGPPATTPPTRSPTSRDFAVYATSSGSEGRGGGPLAVSHTEEVLLRASGIEKSFGGNNVLRGIDVDVLKSGDIVAIVGQNGAGKSTLLNIITGLETPDAGIVEFMGINVTHFGVAARARAGLGRTFQAPRLALDRTCLENAQYGGLAIGGSRRDELASSIRDHAFDCLSVVGLAPFARVSAGELPYGRRKLLEVARSLVSTPQLLLMDEPAAGLSDEEERELGEVLRHVATEWRMSIILIDHRLQLVYSLARQITALDAGTSIFVGTADDLQRDEGVLRAYFGEEPVA